jgi:hypothetical protein
VHRTDRIEANSRWQAIDGSGHFFHAWCCIPTSGIAGRREENESEGPTVTRAIHGAVVQKVADLAMLLRIQQESE